jgi:hypothetical protein
MDRRIDGKGEISLLWFHMSGFCDLQSLKKEKSG